MDGTHLLAAMMAGSALLILSLALRWLTRRVTRLIATLFDDWF